MFPEHVSTFSETDPEFIQRFDNFAFAEVVNQDDLDDKTRFMAILAAQLYGEFKEMFLENAVEDFLSYYDQ